MSCKGIKVLIVEDNEPNQILMRAFCEELECDADYVVNGQEAVDKFKKGHVYDVVLMDLQMPILGGVDACRIIRKTIKPEDTPIIAVTAAVLEDDRNQAKDAGMNDFLSKPFTLDELRDIIIRYGRKT